MYEVLVSQEADKYYKKQNRDTKRRINKCIDNLSVEPLFGPHKGCTENSKESTDIKSVASESFTKLTPKIRSLKLRQLEGAAIFIKDRLFCRGA